MQKLTQARLEKGLSQEQLAKRIGTQRSNICRIEKGTQNLSLDLMIKIAEALDKDVSVVLEERSSTMEKVYSLRLYDETLLILRSAVAGGLYRRGRQSGGILHLAGADYQRYAAEGLAVRGG